QIEIIENIFYKRVDVKKYTVKSIEHLEKIKFFDTNFLLSKGNEILEKLKNGDVFVNGVAGSGKTTLLLYVAINLAVNNPDSNILLTFNTFSMTKTIHRYFNELITIMPDLKAKLDARERKNIKISQISSATNLTDINYILIDEAQDLAASEYYFGKYKLQNGEEIHFDKRLHSLIRKNPNARCVFAYDTSQIFNTNFSFLCYKYEPTIDMYIYRNPDQVKTQMIILNKSYRNTYEILSFANKIRSYFENDLVLIIDEDLILELMMTQIDLDFAPRRGILPELIKVDSKDFPNFIVKKIKELSKEYNLNNYSQFAVIIPSSSYANIIGDALKNENIPFVIFKKGLREKDYSNLPDGAVVISHGARAKGNGWDIVFLIIDRDENLKYLYTCITRAETYLFILYFEEYKSIKLIKEILNSLKREANQV
ncbi:MAG: DNA/RNA helicase domain-containing protein, partial [Thermoplasmata archaeon]